MDGALVSQAHGQAGSQAVCQGHPCSPPPWAQAFFPWAQQSALGGLAHVGRWRLGGSRTLSPGLRPPCHFSASTGRRPGTATTARIQGCGGLLPPQPQADRPQAGFTAPRTEHGGLILPGEHPSQCAPSTPQMGDGSPPVLHLGLQHLLLEPADHGAARVGAHSVSPFISLAFISVPVEPAGPTEITTRLHQCPPGLLPVSSTPSLSWGPSPMVGTGVGGPWLRWPPSAHQGSGKPCEVHVASQTPHHGGPMLRCPPRGAGRTHTGPARGRLARSVPGTAGGLGDAVGNAAWADAGRDTGPLGQQRPWSGLVLPGPSPPPTVSTSLLGRVRWRGLRDVDSPPACMRRPSSRPSPTTAEVRDPRWFRHRDFAVVVWRWGWGVLPLNPTHIFMNTGNPKL